MFTITVIKQNSIHYTVTDLDGNHLGLLIDRTNMPEFTGWLFHAVDDFKVLFNGDRDELLIRELGADKIVDIVRRSSIDERLNK